MDAGVGSGAVRGSPSAKQYDATDPENRLVADELERRWNTALQRVREIEKRIDRHGHGRCQPVVPTREEFENLAADLDTVWRNPHADVRLKKRLVRTLIHEIVVDTDPEAVRSFWSFTGKAACIPNCECRDDDGDSVPRTRRRTSSMQYVCWRTFVPTIC